MIIKKVLFPKSIQIRNRIKTNSISAPVDFTGESPPPMEDLTAVKPGGPGSIQLGSGENPSIFSGSFNDFESVGSRKTINKSTLESGQDDPRPREDLTMSRATRTDGESLEDGSYGDDEDGLSERTRSVEPPPPPPLLPISPRPPTGLGSELSGMTASQLSEGFQGSQVEDVITKQQVADVGASMESFSMHGSSNGGEMDMNRVGEKEESETNDITKSLVSFADDEQDVLDDLINSLGDAFEIKSGTDEQKDEKNEEVEEEEEEDEDEEEFDEKKNRCKGALLAMQVGKFLAEKSEFEQAEEMLMLAYDRIIDVSIVTGIETTVLFRTKTSSS